MQKFISRTIGGNNRIGDYVSMIIALILSQVIGGLCFYGYLNYTGLIDLGKLCFDYVPPAAMLFFSFLPFILSLAAFLIFAPKTHKRPLISFINSEKRVRWKYFLFSFFISLSILILIEIIFYFSGHESYQFSFNYKTFFFLLAIILLLLPIQVTFEEIIFRGYLMQWFSIYTKHTWIIILFVSLLFALLHSSNPEFDYYNNNLLYISFLSSGIFLCVVTILSNGLELAIGVHLANNFINLLIITPKHSLMGAPVLASYDLGDTQFIIRTIIEVVVYIVLIFVFYKRFKLMNWKAVFVNKP